MLTTGKPMRRPFAIIVLKPFSHRGDELLRDGAADDLDSVELEVSCCRRNGSM
jgi:hypothetical protein